MQMECRLDTISIGSILGFYDIGKHCSPNPKKYQHTQNHYHSATLLKYCLFPSIFFAKSIVHHGKLVTAAVHNKDLVVLA